MLGNLVPMDSSPERCARAQTIFRAGNKALTRVAGSADGLVAFLCECGDERCFAGIPLTRRAYEEIRAHPRRFVVAPRHEGEAEPVGRRDGHVVIEKDALAGRIADETDPRGSGRS